jgi:ribosome biogenesis GTPase / thiamine phosphate phosphatase
VNGLLPMVQAKIGDLVNGSDIGAHTTSNAKLYHLPSGGYLVDSPGIREFSLSHLDTQDIKAGFIEISKYSKLCKFRNCKHDDGAVGCAVVRGVSEGQIYPERFLSYKKLIGIS